MLQPGWRAARPLVRRVDAPPSWVGLQQPDPPRASLISTPQAPSRPSCSRGLSSAASTARWSSRSQVGGVTGAGRQGRRARTNGWAHACVPNSCWWWGANLTPCTGRWHSGAGRCKQRACSRPPGAPESRSSQLTAGNATACGWNAGAWALTQTLCPLYPAVVHRHLPVPWQRAVVLQHVQTAPGSVQLCLCRVRGACRRARRRAWPRLAAGC